MRVIGIKGIGNVDILKYDYFWNGKVLQAMENNTITGEVKKSDYLTVVMQAIKIRVVKVEGLNIVTKQIIFKDVEDSEDRVFYTRWQNV